MNFAEKLKKLRKQYNMSQEQLADKIGVSRQAVTKWETNGGMPDIENIVAIATLFHSTTDELLSSQENKQKLTDFFYKSAVQYDIDSHKQYDIHMKGAYEVIVEESESEKLTVQLASNMIASLENGFKIKIDEHKNRLDVDIHNVGVVNEAAAKEALTVIISVPAKYTHNIELSAITNSLRVRNMESCNMEFDGRTTSVMITHVKGLLELNCSTDMIIYCDRLNGKVDVNQISATSTIHIPKDTIYYVKRKGKSNSIFYTIDGQPCDTPLYEDADNIIELAGMNTELIINEYSTIPEGLKM